MNEYCDMDRQYIEVNMASPRYLDATNDVAFKKVFSDKEILKHFLNSLLGLQEGQKIKELDFVPQEEIPDLGQGKRSIFDIKVLDQAGFWYIVEMQNRPDELFLKRVQVYASSTYSNQTLKGKDYRHVLPVVVVSIVNGILFPAEIGCINRHTTREEKTNIQHLFELSYVFVELGKFRKSEDELETLEDFWLFYLSKSTEVKRPPKKITDTNILKAYEVLERFNWNESSYDAYIRAKLLSDTEKFEIEDAYTKGEANGEAKGRLEGKIEGKIEIAKNLISKGFDDKTVLEVTGLTSEELKKYLYNQE